MSSFGKSAISGVFWSYLTFLGTKGISLVSLVILARLLGPENFGLMAICTVVIAYFEIVAKFGLGAALVSAQDHQTEMETAVAIMSVVTSAVMVALAWIAAPYVAAAFDEPGLTWPLRVIALAMMIDAFAVVPATLLSKRLQFRRRAVPDLCRSIVKAVASIGLAMMGYGLWSLVWGHVIGTAAGAVATWLASPWKPEVRPRAEVVWQAFRFGHHLLLAEIINAAQRNLDALLVGKLLGPTALGIYTLAFRMPDLIIRSFNQVAGSVLHPVISSRGAEREGLAALYLSSLRHVALVTFPAGAALSVAAGPIVHLLYTPEWYGMIAPMGYLSISLALLTVDFVPGIIYKAMNRTEFLLWTSVLKLPVFVAVLVLVAPYGLEAIAAAQIGLSLIYFLPNWLIIRRIIGVGLLQTQAALAPALLLATAIAATGYGLTELGIASPALQLAFLAVGFTMVFIPGLLLAVPELRGALSKRLKR